ncbi:HNH endonuclease [Cupriavidus sp. SW-Y-13]|uniref:HNH endonuclease n=1 Tax=Cupriavidus sp. SW-Y-13 TaxID=2653854 RepID=UPI0013666805|nr:HNH endonuclease [Cupriavidus sp. SW-Y-13]MWL91235.1 hypothetical protein [Cupriavidus sp. SW-Y-13]
MGEETFPFGCGKFLTKSSDLLRFWTKVELKNVDSCWEWQGARFGPGYGQIMIGRPLLAHRVAYLDIVGPIPGRRTIRLECGNRLCCNPAHMVVAHNGHVR